MNFQKKIKCGIRQTGKLAGLFFFLIFLFTQCTGNPEPETSNPSKVLSFGEDLGEVTKTRNFKLPLVFTPGLDTIKLPKTILTDTCPKPRYFNLPVKPGGSYTVHYVGGKTVKIDLLPPVVSPLSSRRGAGGEVFIDGEAGGYSYMQQYTATEGLYSSVGAIYRDKSGNLWFGTQGGGVSRYDGKSFTNFTTAQGLANNVVSSICEDKSGNLWFGTQGGGVSRYDGNCEALTNTNKKNKKDVSKSFTNFTTAQGLANNVYCERDKIVQYE